MANNTDKSLIEYPCDFPIKVMGRTHNEFQPTIAALVQTLVPGFDAQSITSRPSSSGNYTGLTITVRVESQDQLDTIYRALHGHEMVSVVL